MRPMNQEGRGIREGCSISRSGYHGRPEKMTWKERPAGSGGQDHVAVRGRAFPVESREPVWWEQSKQRGARMGAGNMQRRAFALTLR